MNKLIEKIKSRRKTDKYKNSGYGQLKTKLFILTIAMMFGAVIFIISLYNLVFSGRLANWVVTFLDRFVVHDYDTALVIYRHVIRDNAEPIIGASMLCAFAVMMWIYLNRFTKYFGEINRGIDALIEENSGDIILSQELSATEKKINQIKHTLEQRKLTSQIAEQRKNDLVVYLAHDLKTPLTSIIGYLTLLKDEKQISEELREKYLGISLEKALRLEDLINEFFEITRYNLSSLTLEYSHVNLTRMLEQLVSEFEPMLAEKSLKCRLVAERGIMISCDVDKLQRVFDNLLRNAVNYSERDSAIYISVSQKESNLSIKFTNYGRTIPQEKLSRIFEQFYRLDASRGTQSGGAGLGLAIAKQIVELHNGTIMAKSYDDMVEFEVEIPSL